MVRFTLQSHCLRKKIFRAVGIKEKCLEFCPNFGYEVVMKRDSECKQRRACFRVDCVYMLAKGKKSSLQYTLFYPG